MVTHSHSVSQCKNQMKNEGLRTASQHTGRRRFCGQCKIGRPPMTALSMGTAPARLPQMATRGGKPPPCAPQKPTAVAKNSVAEMNFFSATENFISATEILATATKFFGSREGPFGAPDPIFLLFFG